MTRRAPSVSPLRNEIDQILQRFQTADKQAKALEEMRPRCPHSVRPFSLQSSCEPAEGQSLDYDCFTFALDLINCPERVAARRYAPYNVGRFKQPGIANALPGPSFIQFLGLRPRRSLESCAENDLVVYYDRFEKAPHAGKVVGETIVSKWGMKGSFWQHGLWEVPSSYGTFARFYFHPPRDRVREQWIAYLSRLAQRVSGFTSLVYVMDENRGNNLNAEELLKLASDRRRADHLGTAQRRARP